MAINKDDGEFGLDCWLDPGSTGDADEELFSDDVEELKSEARKLLNGGSYKYLLLSRWDDDKDEWVNVEEFEAA